MLLYRKNIERQPASSKYKINTNNSCLAVKFFHARRPVGIVVAAINEPIAKALERIKIIERLVKQKIVVKEFRGHWRPSLHDLGVTTH
jgi:hypothetical protein